jgi:hypothetical protein
VEWLWNRSRKCYSVYDKLRRDHPLHSFEVVVLPPVNEKDENNINIGCVTSAAYTHEEAKRVVALWQRFIFAGAEAIGVEDRANIMSQFGIQSFPQDHPSTFLNVLHRNDDALENLLPVYFRKPKSKRVDFDLMRIRAPFLHGDLLQLHFRGAERGYNFLRGYGGAGTRKTGAGILENGAVGEETAATPDNKASECDPVFVSIRVHAVDKGGLPADRCHLYLPTAEDLVRFREKYIMAE